MTESAGAETVSAYHEAGPEGFIQRMLPDATLPRLLIRGAECMMLSNVSFERPMLDVGSGDGSFASSLFSEPIDVGLDPWRAQMEYSRHLHMYRHLVQAAGNPMPFPAETFASILSNSTLEHTPDPADIIKEMGRVARRGATCVITVPSEYFPKFLLGSTAFRKVGLEAPAQAYGKFLNRISRHAHIEPPAVWRGWLEAAGFEVAEWRYYFTPRDTMLLDLGHYLSAPSIVTHTLLKRWVLLPGKEKVLPLARLLAPFATP
ncbi:MAG TPA: methyltransferase domain-containing protein, partial [Dehalococcoidia bacterium]